MTRPTEPGKITGLLKAWSAGDTTAEQQLIPLVYTELRRLARRYRRKSSAGDTLQTTALVHEAYLRLVDIENVGWQDRGHFFAVSAQVMRRLLVDAARARGAAKRGGPQLSLEEIDADQIPAARPQQSADLLALDAALNELAAQDPRRARVIELRVFGGLTVDETARTLGLSPQTIHQDWKLAKAWLLREISEGRTLKDC
jgi:RNA polymerase sigma factor (TIGR02999 family)